MADNKKTLKEISQHYEMWTKDNEKRMTRKNGWNDITDAYYGKLPEDWPYITKIVDPRIRTTLIEKNARLINTKLRGRLVPRESADALGARINNALLDYQWDTANDGGSMLTKMSISDMDARLYASKFALVTWKQEKDSDGNTIFEGNEFYPLDIRDCGLDPTATHIKDANWFQLRTWVTIEELEQRSDGGKRLKNIGKLKAKIKENLQTESRSSSRKTEYQSRIKHLKGLEDRMGEDMAYPVVMLVDEYRKDKWITFSPEYDLILREIDNPYEHGKIPIAQLRYYPLQDDPHGESEVEPVIPIWKAIQATVCGYMDEVILKMRPPLKIIEGEARIETVEYGPEAQWLVTRQDAIEEMRSSGDSLAYFQTTYQALVSAFNVAMGDLSQGVSSFGPFEDGDKTATEIRATQAQQNTRDQKNQNDLGEFIKEVMLMWCSNNKQFLFSDPTKKEHILRIVGKDNYSMFERMGMDQYETFEEADKMIMDVIEKNPDLTDREIKELYDAAKLPKHPVVLNPSEKDPSKLEMKPKLKIENETAQLSVVPKDLEGTFDYIPDIKSMAAGASEVQSQARQNIVSLVTTNPTVLQLLAQDGYRPDVYELIRSEMEGTGLRDTERYFVKIEQNQTIEGQSQAMGGVIPNQGQPGLPELPQANVGGGFPNQMGGPVQL